MNTKLGIYRKIIKRPLDLILSSIALIFFSPLFILIATLVKLKLGSPIIFKQERPGLNEKIFTMYKFRTMSDERDENGDLLPNEMRHNRFGKALRSTSLDELPEIFNIIKGDMSFIGPRPLLVEYLPLYNSFQKQRHTVRPGLSGFAQINGRNMTTWEKRFEYDVEYVKNISFLLDFIIVLKTILKVFKREGVNNSESVTMDKFKGTS